MKQIIIAYIPVLHEGYRQFFSKYPQVKKVFLLGRDFIKDFPQLYKDIRALEPNLIKKALASWQIFDEIEIIDKKLLKAGKVFSPTKDRSQARIELIMPNEEIMQTLAKKYFKNYKVTFDAIFLRWDKHQVAKKRAVKADALISERNFDRKMMNLAFEEANKSSDCWRHVGAVIIKDGKVLLSAHNRHLPSAQQPYIDGDPRDNFHKGVKLELSTSLHAEAGLIAKAAKRGLKLVGAEIYVSTFPCPVCAKQIAAAGFKKLYYAEGYGVLDGERVLKSQGVEIVQVRADDDFESTKRGESKYSTVKKYRK
ncbi:MAG: deaminase [Candidatus Woesebacteria bacterium]|jgi:dCMP deaminase